MNIFHFGVQTAGGSSVATAIVIPVGGVIRQIDFSSYAQVNPASTGAISAYFALLLGTVGVFSTGNTAIQTNVLAFTAISCCRIAATDPVSSLFDNRVLGCAVRIPDRATLTLSQAGALMQLVGNEITFYID